MNMDTEFRNHKQHLAEERRHTAQLRLANQSKRSSHASEPKVCLEQKGSGLFNRLKSTVTRAKEPQFAPHTVLKPNETN